MLINNGDGTFTAGPRDVLCILHDINADTYHPAFFEEKVFPGGRNLDGAIRLKSKFSYTEGLETLEKALEELADFGTKIKVGEQNTWTEPQAWDGEIGVVWLVQDWRETG